MAQPHTSSSPQDSTTPPTMPRFTTRIVPVDASKVGHITPPSADDPTSLDECDVEWNTTSTDYANLKSAADQLNRTDVPVAFPTETVYGLGGDARRDGAVAGIFAAKNRPSDNPLIVHIHSLNQLRRLLRPGVDPATKPDPIPDIYLPVIRTFWPGPISIILPVPTPQPDSPPVLSRLTTAGLTTFGARMPSTPLCRMLLKLSDAPLAAPSANASTRPSPTQAIHVLEDLDGRIETIIDGGPCDVGVESTVVDGITPGGPAILRPGGVGLAALRSCPGWENVTVGYKNRAEGGVSSQPSDSERQCKQTLNVAPNSVPRAPGMKYKHYSPRARVLLYEASAAIPSARDISGHGPFDAGRLGIIRTRRWPSGLGFARPAPSDSTGADGELNKIEMAIPDVGATDQTMTTATTTTATTTTPPPADRRIEAWEISLGSDPVTMAHRLFSAFRDLDRLNVDVILVEGINENSEAEIGGVAAAVMNRIRKAAETVGS